MEDFTLFNVFLLIVWLMSIIGSVANGIAAWKTSDYEKKRYHLEESNYHLIVMWICIFARWIVYFIVHK